MTTMDSPLPDTTAEAADSQPATDGPMGLAAVPCSALYGRVIAPSDDPLMHKVWQGTPWMLDAYTGSINSDRWHDVIEWCRENYGQEAWPIHDRPGRWHTGGATIHGWTWLGFATEEMMTAFAERWQNR